MVLPITANQWQWRRHLQCRTKLEWSLEFRYFWWNGKHLKNIESVWPFHWDWYLHDRNHYHRWKGSLFWVQHYTQRPRSTSYHHKLIRSCHKHDSRKRRRRQDITGKPRWIRHKLKWGVSWSWSRISRRRRWKYPEEYKSFWLGGCICRIRKA